MDRTERPVITERVLPYSEVQKDLSARDLDAYLIAFKVVSLISCHDVKSSLWGGKSLRKTSFGQRSGRCNRKEQVAVLLKKGILCSHPTPLPPPHIMLLC